MTLQAILAFLLLGLVAFVPFDRAWGGPGHIGPRASFGDKVINSVYFSTVTLTTVGYG